MPDEQCLMISPDNDRGCEDLYDCCDCGYGECGCPYCWSCNACEVCNPEDEHDR